MADERQVRATLEVQRTGDAGAFKDTAAEIEKVGDSAQKAAPQVKGFGDAVDAAGDRASSAEGQLRTVGTAIGEVGQKAGEAERKVLAHGESFAASATKAGAFGTIIGSVTGGLAGMAAAAARIVPVLAAVWAAWEGGNAIGRKLKDTLDEYSDGKFSESMSKMSQAVVDFVLPVETAAEAAERLQNEMNVLAKNGFDVAAMSAEEVSRAYQQLMQDKKELADETRSLEAAYEKWIKTTGLSQEALDEAAKQIEFFAEKMKEANEGMSDSDFGAALGKQLQQVLKGFDTLGREAPAHLQRLAKEWGLTGDAAEKAAKKTETAAEKQKETISKLADEIVQQIQPVQESLGDMAAAMEEAFAKIDFSRLTGEGLEKARELVQQLVDQYRAAGDEIPPSLEKAADATGVFLAQIERTVDKGQSFSGAMTDMAESALQVTQEVDAAGNVITRIAEAAGGAAQAVGGAGTALGGAGQAAAGASSAMEDVLAKWQGLKDVAAAAGDVVSEAGGQIADGAQEAGAGAVEIQKTADAGKQAGEGMQTASDAAGAMADSMGTAQDSAAGIADVLQGIASPAEAAQAAMAALASSAETVTGINMGPLVSQLQAVASAAQQAAAAMNQLAASGAGGGGAAAPAPGGEGG